MPSEAVLKPGLTADMEWDGRSLMERAFDSLRPGRLRKLFQRPEVRRRPSEASEQLSEAPEHEDCRKTSRHSGSKVSSETVDKNLPDDRRQLGSDNSANAKLDSTVDHISSHDLTPETYIAGLESGEPPYTGSPSRIIMTSDGTQECLALLLTREMVANMNRVLIGTSKVERLQETIDALETDITLAEISLEQYPSLIEALPDGPAKADEEVEIRTRIEETKERSQHAANSKEMLESTLFREKINLRCSRKEIQEDFQRVLSESHLLEVEDQSVGMEKSQPQASGSPEAQNPATLSESDETIISIDGLNRLTTYEEVETSRQRFHSLKTEFENREAFYNSEFRDYQEAIEYETCVLPQSEFDRIFVRNISVLTRALINAEAEYEDALGRARALRIIGNDFDQESGFVDHDEDGYRESFEADMAAGADTLFIDHWMEATEESENQGDDPLIEETDDWDARTVDISDSISLVAEGRERVRIDRWRERCGL